METRWSSEDVGSLIMEVRGDILWAASGLLAVGTVVDETTDVMLVTDETACWPAGDLEHVNSLWKPKSVTLGLLC